MSVLEKARELGELLAESEQLKRLNSTQAALENDERGMALMEDYRLLQVELIKATRENDSEVKVSDIKDLLMAKQSEIDDYKLTSEYIEAKNDFDELMKNVNDVITFAITGEACSPSKCASCGGGCGGAHS